MTQFRFSAVPISLPRASSSLALHRNTILTAVRSTSQRLVLLVDCPEIVQHKESPVLLWKQLNKLLGTLYVWATKEAYAIDRILMDIDVVFDGFCGYDLFKEWTTLEAVFGLESDIANVTSRIPSHVGLHHVSPTSANLASEGEVSEISEQTSSGPLAYDHVVNGGTFDHLHAGHKILLTMSAWLARKDLTVGMIDNSLLASKRGATVMEPVHLRSSRVISFLRALRRDLDFFAPTIYDPFGPTRTDPKFEVIVGSRETYKGCLAVNDERAKRSFSSLDIFIIDVISPEDVDVQDMAIKISSSDIRTWIIRKIEEGVLSPSEHSHSEGSVKSATAGDQGKTTV
ncbi:Nucleotidylyl transferase [Gonapodya prolifera JEL478]|uniref:Nucleotidylyl transferase n=1 Tax=Gonapodya prolifera (strain JEL478) TaxID=1344416 RepID=A0A139AW72_GONPJ|nr:Nucleotidylyl transferase [Gonapodya prolifera JEL478]|eukprot:KXS20725.1 Nucleotidylyl transferase [Gonapodya prolifera JEL478]